MTTDINNEILLIGMLSHLIEKLNLRKTLIIYVLSIDFFFTIKPFNTQFHTTQNTACISF